MRRAIILTLAVLLYSGTATAQLPSFPNFGFNGVVGELLDPAGVVPSLVQSLTTVDFAPFINSTAGGSDASLAQGSAGVGANSLLTGLLVSQNPAQIAGGLELIVSELLAGLQTALLGEVRFPLPAFPALPGLGGSSSMAGASALDGLPLSP